ncbi:MAG: hypothetical protein M1829_001118 [Trizodia sp. TS-e1964]|nr:MAG: hypothetical protein M1829_001118 [Trizodia sp. TS-e1964]
MASTILSLSDSELEHTAVISASAKFATEIDPEHAILVIFGANSHQFSLPIKLACVKSGFFRAACLGGFKESKEGVVRLPEESAGAFRIFVHFLNTGIGFEGGRDKLSCCELRPYVQAYVLGDRLQFLSLQTAIIEILHEVRDPKLIYEADGRKDEEFLPMMEYECENAMIASPMRRYFVELYIFIYQVVIPEYYSEFLSQAFLLDLSVHLIKRMKAIDEDYHFIQGPDSYKKHGESKVTYWGFFVPY